MLPSPLPDAPTLALDDILYTMSPSPAPQSLSLEPIPSASTGHTFPQITSNLDNPSILDSSMPPPRIPSPETLDHPELESIRARVQQYSLTIDPTNQRESELAAMVLRLTSHLLLHPSPAQLASQAETIADLTFQRNALLLDKAEDRARWQAERECWSRSAEALSLKVRVAQEPLAKEQEMQRYIARLEDDIKAYRRRLSDTQSRLAGLENELSRIRPLLAVQATVLRDSDLWRSEALSTIVAERLSGFGRKLKGKERAVPLPDGNPTNICWDKDGDAALAEAAAIFASDPLNDNSAHTYTSMSVNVREVNPQPRSSHLLRPAKSKAEKQHHHRKDADKDKARDKDRDKKQRNRDDSLPILADARAECILAAARKLGRVRAGILSGFVKERHKLEREAEVLMQNAEDRAEAERNVRQILEAQCQQPQTSQGRATTPPNGRLSHETAEGSSSPSIPLANATSNRASPSQAQRSSGSQRRKSAPTQTPFTSPGMQSPHMPTQFHPSMRPFPTVPAAAQGRHPHMIPHTGFVYFAPGAGQGPMPVILPMPWPLPPGTPPGPPDRKTKQSSQAPKRTPVRKHEAADEGVSTPMDSLVSAARTLIEDEQLDGDAEVAEDTGAKQDVRDEDETEEETPILRRGTRRRATGPAPSSPAPKRRRVANPNELPQLVAGPSTAATKPTRRTRATTAMPASRSDKPKPSGRSRTRSKPQPQVTPSLSAIQHPPPTPVARVRSALDVLADQAAQEQERRPSLDPGSRGPSESVESAVVIEVAPDSGSGIGAAPGAGPRGRVRGRGKGRGTGKTRPVSNTESPANVDRNVDIDMDAEVQPQAEPPVLEVAVAEVNKPSSGELGSSPQPNVPSNGTPPLLPHTPIHPQESSQPLPLDSCDALEFAADTPDMVIPPETDLTAPSATPHMQESSSASNGAHALKSPVEPEPAIISRDDGLMEDEITNSLSGVTATATDGNRDDPFATDEVAALTSSLTTAPDPLEETADLLPEDNVDGSHPAVVAEIESGDEDAEGSIVDESD